jgi:hypothetical protein
MGRVALNKHNKVVREGSPQSGAFVVSSVQTRSSGLSTAALLSVRFVYGLLLLSKSFPFKI